MTDAIESSDIVIVEGDTVLVEVEDGIIEDDGKRYDIGVKDDKNGYFQVFFTNSFMPHVYSKPKDKYDKMSKIENSDITKHFKSLANAYYKSKKKSLDANYKRFISNVLPSIDREMDNVRKDIL